MPRLKALKTWPKPWPERERAETYRSNSSRLDTNKTRSGNVRYKNSNQPNACSNSKQNRLTKLHANWLTRRCGNQRISLQSESQNEQRIKLCKRSKQRRRDVWQETKIIGCSADNLVLSATEIINIVSHWYFQITTLYVLLTFMARTFLSLLHLFLFLHPLPCRQHEAR